MRNEIARRFVYMIVLMVGFAFGLAMRSHPGVLIAIIAVAVVLVFLPVYPPMEGGEG